MTASSCPYCNAHVLPNIDNSSLLDEEGRSLLTILEFPSKVFATRQPVDLDHSYPKSKRVILRDVKRTDRTVHYFRFILHFSSFLFMSQNVHTVYVNKTLP